MIDVHLVKIAFRYFILFFMVTGFYCQLQLRRMVCFMEYLLSFDGCRLFVMQRYSGSDLHGVTAKVIDMPHHCMCYSFTYIVLLFQSAEHQRDCCSLQDFLLFSVQCMIWLCIRYLGSILIQYAFLDTIQAIQHVSFPRKVLMRLSVVFFFSASQHNPQNIQYDMDSHHK